MKVCACVQALKKNGKKIHLNVNDDYLCFLGDFYSLLFATFPDFFYNKHMLLTQ